MYYFIQGNMNERVNKTFQVHNTKLNGTDRVYYAVTTRHLGCHYSDKTANKREQRCD